MVEERVLFSRFVYSAWKGHKCSVPISEEQKEKDLLDLKYCGKGLGEFPKRILEYSTKFKKYVKDVDKDSREYVYYKHPELVKNDHDDSKSQLERKAARIKCSVWACEAIDSKRVKHPLGYEMKIKDDFCSFERGDYVSVHWDYALEKLDSDTAEEINWKVKEVFGE